MENNIIEMKNICISFGDLMANKNVDFSVKEGEIMALLGENGAGKSTLMKILYGLYARDKGEITVEGKKMPHKYSPMDMINLGISMVPQQFMLVDAFTVAENIILGKEKVVGKFVFNKKKAEQLVADLCEEFDIRLNPSDISDGLRRMSNSSQRSATSCSAFFLLNTNFPTTFSLPRIIFSATVKASTSINCCGTIEIPRLIISIGEYLCGIFLPSTVISPLSLAYRP